MVDEVTIFSSNNYFASACEKVLSFQGNFFLGVLCGALLSLFQSKLAESFVKAVVQPVIEDYFPKRQHFFRRFF